MINNKSLPMLNGCNLCAAAEPFLHADRILDFHVLIYVIEGAIYVTEGDTDYTVGAGELLFLKKGIRHFGKVEIPKGTRWYFMHFYLEEQEALSVFTADGNPAAQNELLQSAVYLPKKLSHLAGSEIEEAVSSIIKYSGSDDCMKKWYLNVRLFELLSLIAFYGKTKQKKKTLSDEICGYLNRHRKEPFSAKELEEHFFLSYKHMAAVFKKEKQMTMQQYHTKLRMQEACKMLESTLTPVGEISEQLGYADMLYFSRCFRQFTGMSPTEYRKNAPRFY